MPLFTTITIMTETTTVPTTKSKSVSKKAKKKAELSELLKQCLWLRKRALKELEINITKQVSLQKALTDTDILIESVRKLINDEKDPKSRSDLH